MKPILTYTAAAAFEIAGCFAVWAVLRQGRPAWWLAVGVALLIAFAVLLATSPAAFAGRAYAAYGGVYVAAALLWLWGVDGVRPDAADLAGGALVLAGAGVILFWPR